MTAVDQGTEALWEWIAEQVQEQRDLREAIMQACLVEHKGPITKLHQIEYGPVDKRHWGFASHWYGPAVWWE